MKKYRNRTILIILFFVTIFGNLKAADTPKTQIEESFWNPASQFKMVFGDLGYGPRNLSAAVGFRYAFLGVDIGLGGIIRDIPNYIWPSKEFPMPKAGNYAEEKFARLSVSFDFLYYYDVSDFSFFAGLGYYSQTDTVLAKSYEDLTRNIYFRLREERKSGLCFTLGGQYFISDMIAVGVGYHTKKGIFLEVGYFWY